jgi:uncharacterized RDD family membrane protein YckC
MRPSSRVARIGAYFVDFVLVWIVGFVLGRFGFLYILLVLVYFVGLTYYKGATLGKMFFGLRVVGDKKQKLGVWQVVLRETVGKFVSGIVLGLGFVWILFDVKRQGWHDKIANTRVIEEKALDDLRKILAYIFSALFVMLVLLGLFGWLVSFALFTVNPSLQIQKAQLQQQQLQNSY